MSRIDELLADLAPDGVDFRAIDNVISSLRTGLNPRQNFELNSTGATNFYITVRELGGFELRPTAKTDRVDSKGLRLIQNRAKLKKGDVLFSGTGTIGRTALVRDDPIDWNIKEGVYAITPRPEYIDSRFMIYLLHSSRVRAQVVAQAEGSTVASIAMATLRRIRIPVPPLEVQRDIVEILDHFTELEAELGAELESRRRQYAFYRDRLLTHRTEGDVRLIPMRQLAEVRSGWGFPHSEQGGTDGAYPFYKVSDMNLLGNETVMSIASNYVSVAAARKLGVRPAPAGTIIFPKIGAAVATNKKRLLSRPSAYDNNVMGLVPTTDISSRFLYYWMQTFDLSSLAHDSGAVPSIRKSEVEEVLVPVPDRAEQDRIVSILDSFDTLVNDLSVGLPAELKARRQQYEHYRDRLLTFGEAPA